MGFDHLRLLPDRISSDLLFQLEHKSSSDVLQYTRGAGFLELFDVTDPLVIDLVGEENRPTARPEWLTVKQQCFLCKEQAR